MARNVLTAIIIPVKYISKYNKIYVNRGAKVMILFLFLYLCPHKLETNDKKNEENRIYNCSRSISIRCSGKSKITSYDRRQHGATTANRGPALGLGEAWKDNKNYHIVER